MILADTSVWIDHLRVGNRRLVQLLDQNLVVSHPFVIGELACGNLQQRSLILGLLQDLPQAPVIDDAEVLVFIEERQLMGRGIGYIDAHLLSSCVMGTGTGIWTFDKRLQGLAKELGAIYLP